MKDNYIVKADVLKKLNMSEEDFIGTGLKWENLLEIEKDYEKLQEDFESVAKYIVESLQKVSNVHSVKYRIKSPLKLLIKIIRKKQEDPQRNINIENYREEITDLIGIRILHLFKKDWKEIGDFIERNWNLHEKPIIYKRNGDDIEYFVQAKDSSKYEIIDHPHNYRSVHFLVKSFPNKEMRITEIQVRTIFEEAWSEIDHRVRYPMNNDEILLNEFLALFNKLAGSADEMGSYVMNLKDELTMRKEKAEGENQAFQKKIEKLQDKIKQLKLPQKESIEIVSGLGRLSDYYKKVLNSEYAHDNYIYSKHDLISAGNESPYSLLASDLDIGKYGTQNNSQLILGEIKNDDKK